jgi:ribonuclease HI
VKFQTTLEFEAKDALSAEEVAKRVVAFVSVKSWSMAITLPVEVPPEPPATVDNPPDMTTVYTDGGCNTRKKGLGAWAFRVVLPTGEASHKAGGIWGTTNNRMELMAVTKALEFLEIGPPVRVVSDSEYVIKGLTLWHKSWVKHNWVNYEGKKIKNRDLWEPLIALHSLHNVEYQHVKGHSGHVENEAVDALCTATMKRLEQERLQGKGFGIDPNGPIYDA